MQIFSTVAALAFLASAVNALTITTPVSGTTVTNPIQVLVDNSVGESFTNVQITFASACGSFTRSIPVGFTQTICLPANIQGVTNVVASVSSGSSATAQVVINSVLPYAGACASPCAAPCASPCADPYIGGCGLPCASPCFTPSALPPVPAAGLPGYYPCDALCASPCASPCGRLSRRSRRSARALAREACANLPTATPCDNLYYNPPCNLPAPDCARRLPRCGRLYGGEAEDVQSFSAEQQQQQN